MFKVAIAGANGNMGLEISSLLNLNDKLHCVAKIVKAEEEITDSHCYTSLANAAADIDKIDVLIDFTSSDASMKFAESCANLGVAHVCGSTGFTKDQIAVLQEIAKNSLLFLSPNMSIGVAVLKMLCKKAARVLDNSFDVEILEMHHNKKADAP